MDTSATTTTTTEWNTHCKVTINNIRFNQDNTLLVLATSRGYRIFDSRSFTSVSSVNDYHDIIGDIAIAQTLYKSHLVFLVGTLQNSSILHNQLVIWNDMKNQKDSIIFFKDTVNDFHVSKHILYVFTSSKLLLFELSTLTYIASITNILNNPKLYDINTTNDVIVHNTFQKRNVIQSTRFYVNDSNNYKLTTKAVNTITTGFKDIQSMKLSHSGAKLIVLSLLGNKLHVYDMELFQLQCCLYINEHIHTLDNICVDVRKENYVMFIGDDAVLKVYSMKRSYNEKGNICKCNEHDDDEVLLGKKKEESLGKEGFLGGWLNKFQGVVSGKKKNDVDMYVGCMDVKGGKEGVMFMAFDAFAKKELVFI